MFSIKNSKKSPFVISNIDSTHRTHKLCFDNEIDNSTKIKHFSKANKISCYLAMGRYIKGVSYNRRARGTIERCRALDPACLRVEWHRLQASTSLCVNSLLFLLPAFRIQPCKRDENDGDEYN